MPGSVAINGTAWWVTGGKGLDSITTSEIYTLGTSWEPYLDLPFEAAECHCNVKINDTDAIVLVAKTEEVSTAIATRLFHKVLRPIKL